MIQSSFLIFMVNREKNEKQNDEYLNFYCTLQPIRKVTKNHEIAQTFKQS